MTTYTDRSIMPFGIHKGKTLANVPDDYLLYLCTQRGWDKSTPLGRYIESNLEVLKKLAKAKANAEKQLRR